MISYTGNGFLLTSKEVVPRNYVNTVLEETHDSPSGGHFGVNKTLQKIRKKFYWAKKVKKLL